MGPRFRRGQGKQAGALAVPPPRYGERANWGGKKREAGFPGNRGGAGVRERGESRAAEISGDWLGSRLSSEIPFVRRGCRTSPHPLSLLGSRYFTT